MHVPCVYVMYIRYDQTFRLHSTGTLEQHSLPSWYLCLGSMYLQFRQSRSMNRILGCPLFFHFVAQGLTFCVQSIQSIPAKHKDSLLLPILCLQKELFHVTDQWIDLTKQTEIQDTHADQAHTWTNGLPARLPSGPFRHGLWWDINQKPVNYWIICRLPDDPKFLGLPCMHQWWHVVICHHNFHMIYYPQPSRASQ